MKPVPVLAATAAVLVLGACGAGEPAAVRGAETNAGTARVEAVLRPSVDVDVEFTVHSLGVFDYRGGRLDLTWEDDDGGSGREIVVDGNWYSEIPEVNRGPDGKRWLRMDIAAAANTCDRDRREGTAGPRTWIPDAGLRAAALFYGVSTSWYGDPGGIRDYLRRLGSSPVAVAREDVNGVPTTLYVARISSRHTLVRVLEEAGWSREAIDCRTTDLADDPIEVDVWIGDDGLARRLRSVETYRLDEDPDTELQQDVATFEFSDFGAPVRIEPPPPAEVLDAGTLEPDSRIEEPGAHSPTPWPSG